MLTTQKEIRNFYAAEITSENIEYLKKCSLRCIAYSRGTYGCNGRVYFNEDDKHFYKISSRNGFLFYL